MRFRGVRGVLAGLLLIGVASAGCSPKSLSSRADGNVTVALVLPGGGLVNTVDYTITGNGVAPIMGMIDVSAPGTTQATALVSGLPAGMYTVTMAASASPDQSCSGSTPFTVVAGQTAMATVVLQCKRPPGPGSVAIGGRLDQCPTINGISATSLQVRVGGSIVVGAAATDLDGDTIRYIWTNGNPSAGTLTPTNAATAVFHCNAVGTTQLSIAIADEICGDTLTNAIPIACTADTQGTAGGAGGRGGGGGTGGSGGTDGTDSCPGSQVLCIDAGCFSDVIRAGATCDNGSWVCPTGTVPSSSCPCVGPPPMATCFCGPTGWNCSPVCLETNPPPTLAARCQACLAQFTIPATDGCCPIVNTDPQGYRLCQAASACMRAGGGPVGMCNISGDTVPCYCGTNIATCDNEGQPNGPCVASMAAAAGWNVVTHTGDSTTPIPTQVLDRLGDPNYAIGRATSVQSLAAALCSDECGYTTFGTGGTGGDAGAPPLGCTVSDPPPSATIADFQIVSGGLPVIPIGGTFTYSSPISSPAPTATVSNGRWHITVSATGMQQTAQYLGVGMYFNGNLAGTDCVDASAFTGVRFDVGGTVTGACSASFEIDDSEHSDSSFGGKASCPPGAYAPTFLLSSPPVGVTQTISVPFTGMGAPIGGNPTTAIDKAKLVGLIWQFTLVQGVTGSCRVDLTIDNVTFY